MILIALIIAFIGSPLAAQQAASDANWLVLFDGSNLDNWNASGDAKFKIVDGAVQTESGNGTLMTKTSYKDFEISGEFWSDETANSGIYFRCSDPQRGGSGYEVNIYDSRPDPTYATGSIVNVASPSAVMKTAGKWNTYVIQAQGAHITVAMNGTKTVDIQNNDHPEGFIGLQFGAGVVKFRNIKIRRL